MQSGLARVIANAAKQKASVRTGRLQKSIRVFTESEREKVSARHMWAQWFSTADGQSLVL
jgi:hypothetical protein